MASSAQRHKRHTDVDWLQHRHFIQEMYIDRNKTLQDVVKSLADLGFNVTKSQLEYKTKIWGFTKKLKRGSSKSTWQYIGHRVAQRKRQGKQSRVEINGSIIGNTKIASETRRYEPKSCAYDYQAMQGPQTPEGAQICISTPPNTRLITWTPDTSNLPWIKFQINFSALFPAIVKVDPRTIKPDFGERITPVIWNEVYSTPGPVQSSTAHQMASKLNLVMPEAYDEENLHRARLITQGPSKDALLEHIKAIFFQFSNNLHDRLTWKKWSWVLRLIQLSGITESITNFRQIQDATIAAALDTIFKESFAVLDTYAPQVEFSIRRTEQEMQHTTASASNNDEEELSRSSHPIAQGCTETVRLIHWFLESGKSPEIWAYCSYWPPAYNWRTGTPLQIAARVGIASLLHDLLNHGADPNNFEDGPSPLAIAIANLNHYDHRSGGVRLPDIAEDVQALLSHGAQILIGRNSERSIDYDVLAVTSLNSRWNPLERAAGLYSEEMAIIYTEYLLDQVHAIDLQRVSYQQALGGTLVTAAFQGYNTVLMTLFRKGVPADSENAEGFTAMHSAALGGHLDTCLLLIEFQGYPQPSEESLYLPSPMHLAALNGHRDIVRLFQDYGVDMNIAVDLSNQLFAKSVLRHLCESSHGGVQEEDFQCIIEHHGDHFTPLSAAILRDPYGTSFRWLIDMGAILPQWALYQGSCSKNIDLVSAALQCGMSPNVRGWEPDGPTTLHSALTPRARLDIEGREACMRCANILIENGAHLGNSEVAQANLLGDGAYFTRLCNIQEANNSHSSGDLYNPEAICAAIFKDQEDVNLDFVRQVLQKRDTENEVLQAETSAICMAAWLGNCPILDLLLSKLPASQFISLKKNSLLGDLVAMDHSNKSLISIFTNCSAWKTNKTIEISPLCFSLYSQEALSLLLRHGYKPDRLTLSAAVSFGFDIVNTLVRGGEILESPLPDRVLSPICHAIVHSDFEAIKMLSEAGEDINSGHWWMDNALACAAKLGDIEAACLLIDLGADCNPPLEFSPLLYAAGEGNIEVAKLLIANGADVNFTSECNQSPLWAAAEAGKIDFLQLLLSNGAETEGNCRRSYMDAVLIARCKGHATVEKVLKEHREWTDEDRSLYEEMRTNGFFREADIQFDSLAEPHGMNRGDLPSSSAAIGLWGWSDEDFEDLVNFDYEGDLII